jgi:hypothetical protein
MGCSESCNAKDFEARVNDVYVVASQYFDVPTKLPVMSPITLCLHEDNEEITFSTTVNDIPPSDRTRILEKSQNISKEAVAKLTERSRKKSLFVLSEDELLKKMKRQLE